MKGTLGVNGALRICQWAFQHTEACLMKSAQGVCSVLAIGLHMHLHLGRT